jgi:hypothetical protein
LLIASFLEFKNYYFDTVEFGGVVVMGIFPASAWSALA